jgi:hypothetical protein
VGLFVLSSPRRSSFLAAFFGLVVVFGCLAAERPAEADSVERVPDQSTPEAYLRARVALWKQRLKLQDWSVSVVISRQSELRPGTLGNIHWDPDARTAVIRVLGAVNGEAPSHSSLMDMEDTIVHELVHLELASLPKTDASRSDEEFAVDHLTDALLKLDRSDTAAQTTH